MKAVWKMPRYTAKEWDAFPHITGRSDGTLNMVSYPWGEKANKNASYSHALIRSFPSKPIQIKFHPRLISLFIVIEILHRVLDHKGSHQLRLHIFFVNI